MNIIIKKIIELKKEEIKKNPAKYHVCYCE